MKRITIVFLFVCAVLGWAAGARANDTCNEVCTCETACNQLCHQGGEWLTCEDWGYCVGSPICTHCYPNYQVIDWWYKGGEAIDDYQNNKCYYNVATELLWHDQEECPDSEDYTTCYEANMGEGPLGLCCVYYYCFGEMC